MEETKKETHEKTAVAQVMAESFVPDNQRNFMNDQVFKFVFGKKEHKAITLDFLNACLKEEFGHDITDFEFDPQENSPEHDGDKETRLDVVCRLDNGALVDIEVQLVDLQNMAQRTLYYWAGEYRNSLPAGGSYRDLRPTVTINILGFQYFAGDEAFTSWGVCNLKTHERLTKDLSFHFLEIPKFANLKKPRDQWTKIERWMCFFSNKMSVSKKKELLKEDDMISKAIAATDQFFRDPAELRLYWEKERARMDQRERELCVAEENFEKGREDLIASMLKKCSATQVASLADLPLSYVEEVARRCGRPTSLNVH